MFSHCIIHQELEDRVDMHKCRVRQSTKTNKLTKSLKSSGCYELNLKRETGVIILDSGRCIYTETLASVHPTHTCPEVHSSRAVLLVSAPDTQLAVGVIAPALDAAVGYHRTRVFVAQADGRGRNT